MRCQACPVGRGAYVYVLGEDSVEANCNGIPVHGAAQVMGAMDILW